MNPWQSFSPAAGLTLSHVSTNKSVDCKLRWCNCGRVFVAQKHGNMTYSKEQDLYYRPRFFFPYQEKRWILNRFRKRNLSVSRYVPKRMDDVLFKGHRSDLLGGVGDGHHYWRKIIGKTQKPIFFLKAMATCSHFLFSFVRSRPKWTAFTFHWRQYCIFPD